MALERPRRREQIGGCLLSAITSHAEDDAATGVCKQLLEVIVPPVRQRFARQAVYS